MLSIVQLLLLYTCSCVNSTEAWCIMVISQETTSHILAGVLSFTLPGANLVLITLTNPCLSANKGG